MKAPSLLFTGLFLFAAVRTLGQDDNPPLPTPDLVPPLPSAAKLGSFGENPVGLNTGTIQQDISIYTFKTKHLSVPISIGYASNGVRVDDMDDKCGIDWSLHAGGVITRTVYGFPDEYFGGPFNPPPYSDWGPSTRHATALYNWVGYQATQDNEYDQFDFNFGSYSGSFIVNLVNGVWTPTLLPYSNLKITSSMTKAPGGMATPDSSWVFKITTPDGTEYYFGENSAIGSSYAINGCSGDGPRYTVPSAWYLTRIVHPYDQTDVIHFYYSLHGYNYTSSINASMRLVDPNGSVYNVYPRSCYSPPDIYGDPVPLNNGYENDCYMTTYANTVELDSITAPNFGKVWFVWQGQPANIGDGTKDSLLQAVRIYQPNNLATPMITDSLTYYFSIGNQSFNPVASTPANEIDARSFLTSFIVKDQNDNPGEVWQFNYYGIDSLASRLSFAQDYYGFFNGVNNSRFIPASNWLLASLNIPVANFTPDSASTTKGMLRQVIYPTGGNSLFTYELPPQTSIPLTGSLRIKTITTYDPVQNQSSIHTYTYNLQNTAFVPQFYYEEIHQNNYYVASDPADICGALNEIIECDYYMCTSNSQIPIMGRGGYLNYYGEVTEGFGANFENGGIEHYYNSPALNPLNLLQGPPIYNITAPAFNYKWTQETNTNYFKMAGHDKVYTRKVTNTWTADPRISQTLTQYVLQKNDIRGYGPDAGNPSDVADTIYFLGAYSVINDNYIQEWDYMSQTVDQQYDLYGNPTVATTTNYYYDNPAHAQVTRIVTADSKGGTLQTTYKYVGDQGSMTGLTTAELNAIAGLQAQYRINTVLEKDNYRNGELMDETQTEYQDWTGSGLLLPDTVKVQAGGKPIESRLYYQNYDLTGNLISYARSADATTAIIWDYHNSYPIAEVKNAVPADIVFTSFESNGTGGWSVPSTARNTTAAVTGGQSYSITSGNNITYSNLTLGQSYIVSYWSQNGALNVNGTTATAGLTKNGWTYYQHLLNSVTTNTVTVSGTALIDELRLYPQAAQMTTYTYTPQIGITSQCDAQNRVTTYGYDAMNRLAFIKDQDGNIVKTYQYNYQN